MLFIFGACKQNEFDADTWTDQLDDSHEFEHALTEIEHLGDPKAIPAVGKAWENQGCPQRALQVMTDLAHPLTPEEADKGNFADFAKSGRPASWDKALPFLTEALQPYSPDATGGGKCNLDDTSPRSIENAGKAAEALGQAQTDQAAQVLIDALGQKYSPKAQPVRLQVLLALGKYKSGAVVKALTDLLRNSPENEPPAIVLGAVSALAQIKSPEATEVLIETMYRVPLGPVFAQVRRALVASGPNVAGEMKKILNGTHEQVNKLFADNKLDQYCGDKDIATGKITKPITPCKPTSIKEYYAAIILGDLYDQSAAKDLVAKLQSDKPQPVSYSQGNPAPNSQFNAYYDSLRKIGASDGADVVMKIWNDPKGDIQQRVNAVGAYPFIARGSTGAAELGKIAADNGADDALRLEAATAYARLAQNESDINALLELAAKYKKAADEAAGKAEAKRPAYEAAKKTLDDAKAKLAAAKAQFQKEGGIKKASAETINAMTAAQKAVDDADEPYDNARAEWKPLDNAAKDYRSYQRTFETHVARVEVYIHCKGNAKCFADALDAKPDEIAVRVGKYVKTINNKLPAGQKDPRSIDDVWTDNDKKGLVAAGVERAMLELGKMGEGARDQTAALLDHAKTEDRLVRQSILLALPKVAPKPCPDCEAKLDAAIKVGSGKSELA
ncbi:MAG TPA: HEAT repeat domain-containing protein, partial [Kofleriaceae bacterium]|nr:HEAT repeat domain-containing protein [Kofleriaceae bacterium]